MNKSEDPNAPKNQPITEAPHGGQNRQGDIVADSTESAGQDSDWEATSDLDTAIGSDLGGAPGKVEAANEEGYSSGPDTLVAAI